MMRRISTSTETRLIPILIVALVAFAVGCAGTSEPVEEPPEDTGSEFTDEPVMSETVVSDTVVVDRNITVSPVYFDFDKSDIRPEFESVLQGASQALKDSGVSVVIEGHTDERGSEEYNIALGERRATAVRKYLYNLGVPMGQMSVVSYGEARPAVSGTGEAVWQLNRRAEFRIR